MDIPTELLPCPFCGGGTKEFPIKDGHIVQCIGTDCRANPQMWGISRHAAFCNWNRRYPVIGDDGVRSALEDTFLARLQLRDHQDQLDADGVMVGVSRQALDEVLDAFDKLDAITTLEHPVEGE